MPDSARPPVLSAELAPARALLTPTWVAALALLVANDHWLKGADLVPGVLTGKLSDFAGLIVAPVLLATLLQVRSRRALMLCHVAVAAVFTGIQLSTSVAAVWSNLMGALGHPWVITSDPTDLIALPMLLVAWVVLIPEMDASKPALIPIQRTAVAGLGVFGLWATVATSDNGGLDSSDEWYFDVYGHVYVNNANDFPVALHIRKLRGDVDIDCAAVEQDPGRLLPEAAFGEAEHWELPGRTNVSIEFDEDDLCGAAWVAGEGIPPRIVFDPDSSFHQQWFPGQTFSESGLGMFGVGVVFGDNGGEWIGSSELLHVPNDDAPELPEQCEPPSGESRIDWSEVPQRSVELLEISPGVDGCYELVVQELELFAGVIEPHGDPYPFYLCAPEQAVPFVVGDRLSFEEQVGVIGIRELTMVLLDPDSLVTAVDNGVPVRRIRYVRGGTDPEFIGPAFNRTVVGIPSASCPWLVDPTCATVERPTQLAVEDGGLLDSNVPLEFTDTNTQFTVTATYARQRAVVNRTCSEGAARLSYDIDFVVITQPAI